MAEFEEGRDGEGRDTLAIRTSQLRLVFRREGDRWSHAIELGPDSASYRFAESIEGDPDPDDPGGGLLPVYRNIRPYRTGANLQILADGEAGRRPFAGIFTVKEAGPAGLSRPQRSTWIGVIVGDLGESPSAGFAAAYAIRARPDSLDRDVLGRGDYTWWFGPEVPSRDRATRSMILDARVATPNDAPESIDVEETGPGEMTARIVARIRSGPSPYELAYLWRYVESPRSTRSV